MRSIHLNETEIQQFVLHKDECDLNTLEHMRNCGQCKEKADQYLLLFREIKNQEAAVFDFDLADLVMKHLPISKPKVLPDSSFWLFIAAIAVLPILIFFLVFGNTLLVLLGDVAPLAVALIGITVVGIFAFLFIDMFRKYQARIKALNLG